MFSVFYNNVETSLGHMLVKSYSDSNDMQIIAKELYNHYESSYAQIHAQDIQANLTNLHIAAW